MGTDVGYRSARNAISAGAPLLINRRTLRAPKLTQASKCLVAPDPPPGSEGPAALPSWVGRTRTASIFLRTDERSQNRPDPTQFC